MRPRPFTILTFDPGVDCALLDSIRHEMEAVLQCRQGVCGEGAGNWGL
jgi:hypothetical protein